MKWYHPFLCLCLAWLYMAFAPIAPKRSLIGAWQLKTTQGEALSPAAPTGTWVFAPDYSTMTYYDTAQKKFLSTFGGPYILEGKTLTQTIDFSTSDTSLIGRRFTFKVKPKGPDQLILTGELGEVSFRETFERVDDGQAALTGAYRITARMGRSGEMKPMKFGPRKTIKILSGTRFQWTAINTATKEFFGCGGGTYTFKDGVYTETIEFFSRDSSRVGMSLSFEGRIRGDDWDHSGKSSRGRDIKEIWTRGRAGE